MKKFADRMESFEEGIFQVLDEKRKQRLEQGKTVYNFSVGTPDFAPSEVVMQAVVQAAQKPENYKYALSDLPQLTEAVQKKYETRYGVSLEKEEITSVYGSQEGIAHIGLSLCDPEDIVLVPNPGYPIFGIGPSLAGAEVVTYDLEEENGYLPDLKAIDAETVRRTKIMIVSYPLNPVCKAAPPSFYEELIAWAKQNDILIVHDNAYSDIIYDGREGRSILSYEGAKEMCVEFYSLSKSFNYTGARVGFLVGSKAVVQNFKKLRSQIDYGTFLPVQYGAVAALTQPDTDVVSQCREYERRRNALCDGLTAIGWTFARSEGTMFAWAKLPDGYEDDAEFVMELLEKSGVLCTPGSSFGSKGRGYVRFALVHPVPVIEEAVQSVKNSGVIKSN
ncbi:MAG: aminotransferase class I/II-fold pyridoxal phosphate-dependent enzyme [Lachnospiraceae bacterium]|nr:aminotransferase class I/II-fold pyridoxal phosphate-dependent enzyme [Lachnospiraceae bacterium]